jgi:hypothetical protein
MKNLRTMNWVLAGLIIGGASSVCAESVTNNLNLSGGFIYNHGIVNPGDLDLTFTNAGIRDITISVGQLSGVDPETGDVITNATNLLSLKAQAVETTGDITAGGMFAGDGSGLTNLNAESISGTLPSSILPSAGAWNAAGLTIQNATLSGDIQVAGETLTISTNLTVQGTISGNGSGLSDLPAGGTDGNLQFNEDGQLAGNPDYYIHSEAGKLAYKAQQGNLLRAYNGEVTDANLVYVHRAYENTTEICMLNNGEETIRMRGDGSIYVAGTLEVTGGVTFGGEDSAGSTGWFIPEEGDLSMGTFTQE